MIVYEGWDDADASRAVRGAGVEVDAAYVDNDGELLDAMRAGVGHLDLVWIDNRVARIGIEEQLVVPLDFARLPSAASYVNRFAAIARYFGDTWTAPFVWGTCPVSYNADRLEPPPASLRDFCDARYDGKLVIRDEPFNQITIFARALGHENPLALTHDQLAGVIDFILELRRRTHAPVVTLSSLYDLLCAGDLPLATGAGWEGVDIMAARRGAAVRS